MALPKVADARSLAWSAERPLTRKQALKFVKSAARGDPTETLANALLHALVMFLIAAP